MGLATYCFLLFKILHAGDGNSRLLAHCWRDAQIHVFWPCLCNSTYGRCFYNLCVTLILKKPTQNSYQFSPIPHGSKFKDWLCYFRDSLFCIQVDVFHPIEKQITTENLFWEGGLDNLPLTCLFHRNKFKDGWWYSVELVLHPSLLFHPIHKKRLYIENIPRGKGQTYHSLDWTFDTSKFKDG